MNTDERRQARRELIVAGDALYKSGQPGPAAAKLSGCLRLYDEDEKSSEEWGRFCLTYGSALAESRNLKLALMMFKSAVAVYLGLGNMAAVGTAYLNLGNVYVYANNHQLAFDNYTLALNAFRALDPEGPAVARSLLALAHFFFSIGADDLAKDYLGQFERLDLSVRNDPETMWSWRMQQAKVEIKQGHLSASLKNLEEALGFAKQIGDPGYVAQTESSMGQVQEQLGDTPEALRLIENAYQEAKRESSPYYIERSRQFASALERRGETERALVVYRDCLRQIELVRTQLDFGERFRFMESTIEITRAATRLLFANSLYTEAFEVSECGQARTTLDLMFRHQIRHQGGRVVRCALNGRAILDSPTLDAVRRELDHDDIHLLKLYRGNGCLLAWFIMPGQPMEAWDATSALGPMGDLLALLLSANLPGEISGEAGPVMEVRGGVPATRPQWSRIESALSRFWRALMPESLRNYLRQNSGSLVILPHQESWYIPFGAVCDIDHHPLGQQWDIAVAPSAGVFMHLNPRRDPDGAAKREGALAVGGVASQSLAVSLIPGRPDPRLRITFGELPSTTAEATRVVELLGGEVLLGPEATVSSVVSRIPDYRVLHLASHGFWSPAGDVSLVLLERGILTSQDVIDLRFTAEITVLSACQTGLGTPHPDSYTGLAQSFLIGGSRSVLVSLWPVDDSATLFFMEHFYRELKNRTAPAEALLCAQKAVRDNLDVSDGYNWAAFQLVGRPFSRSEYAKDSFEGPTFCGGDVILMGMQPGDPLSVERYRNAVQLEGQALIFGGGNVTVFTK
jgi:tetratricopeptide (TPR) repeat protein